MSDRPILFNNPFPESQVRAPYKKYTNKIMGTVAVTAGFMEPSGHGYKSSSVKAIYRNGKMKTISPGRYNIGFDYSVGFGSNVTCMYSGKVSKAGREGGYGYRIHVEIDIPFVYQGKNYKCYQAYAHCSKLLKSVGQRVSQGETIAIEAGHGSRGPNDYGSHVDLDTYCYIKGEKIRINFELLAQGVDESDFIEQFEIMNIGSSGLDVELLQQTLKIPITGEYDATTKAAVTSYQKNKGLGADGIAGEDTCKSLNLYGFFLKAKQDTVLKAQPVQSSELAADDIIQARKNATFLLEWVEDLGDHWKFELSSPEKGRFNWHAFKDHVAIAQGYEKEEEDLGDIEEQEEQAQDLTRWAIALRRCSTQGCSSATATGEGLSKGGIDSSHIIVKKDLPKYKEKDLSLAKRVAIEFNVPFQIIIALASRETHIGTLLGLYGSSPGWGDHNNAFGILQVDKRYHSIKGTSDPFSLEHLRQAIGIFASYRDQIERKYSDEPEWDDSNILKGACVAYNSGVSNVRSIEGMNRGTTHNDYGDDAIARAQYILYMGLK